MEPHIQYNIQFLNMNMYENMSRHIIRLMIQQLTSFTWTSFSHLNIIMFKYVEYMTTLYLMRYV